MNRRSFNRIITGLGLAAASIAAQPAMAAWPEKPINLVVPYAPGGTADALARLVGQHLGTVLKTPVVVQNKSGASGIIGQGFVAKSDPDGYTVLYDATPLSINPFLQTLAFDPKKDLDPVTMVAVTPMLLVVPKSSSFDSAQKLIAAAKKDPGKITFGSGGQGTVQYMGGELFSQGAGVKMLHVPYKSGGPFIQAVMSGEIDMGFVNLPSISNQIKGGYVKPLAISSKKRSTLFPDVPTVEEVGIKGYEAYEWNGIFVPGGTPTDIIKKLQSAIVEVLSMPEVKQKFDSLGAQIVGSTSDEFRTYLNKESSKWATTVEVAGIKKN